MEEWAETGKKMAFFYSICSFTHHSIVPLFQGDLWF